MKKKGMSAIVTIVILVALSLVAIGIVWVVISNIITERAEDILLANNLISLGINRAYLEGSQVIVSVKRNPGRGDLAGVAFVFSDGENSYIVEKEISLGELGEQSFEFFFSDIEGMNLEEIIDVSIAPLFKRSDGELVKGNIMDEQKIKQLTYSEYVNGLNSLVSWWRFEGNANDAVGGNDGTISGGVSFDDAVVGQGAVFDGDDSVQVQYKDSLKFDGSMSLSAWIYPREDKSTTETIVYKNRNFRMITYNNWAYFWIYNSDADHCYAQKSEKMGLNKWIHVVGVYDGSETAIYVNGILLDTTSCGDVTIENSEIDLFIGASSATTAHFNGDIDEVMIFNKALSPGEIKKIYDLTK